MIVLPRSERVELQYPHHGNVSVQSGQILGKPVYRAHYQILTKGREKRLSLTNVEGEKPLKSLRVSENFHVEKLEIDKIVSGPRFLSLTVKILNK